MRFALYSHDTLVGFTALDIQCVQSSLRQGFLEPADGADAILDAATGVPPVLAASMRARRKNAGAFDAELDAAVQNALRARDTLDLSLHDEQGKPFDCDFIRIYDLRDSSFELGDDVCDDADDELEGGLDADWEVQEASWDEDDDSLEAFFGLADDSPSIPFDERWDTERFLIQVFLHRPERVSFTTDRSPR